MKEYLTDMDFAILQKLGDFTFLTNSQLRALEVSKSARSLAHALRSLTTFPTPSKSVIGVLKYPPQARLGRVEHTFFLKKGALPFLRETNLDLDLSKIHLPVRPQPLFRDYLHRKLAVDCHIVLSDFLGRHYPNIAINFWHTYFQKSGANRSPKFRPLQAKTRISLSDERFAIPDVVFHLRMKNSERPGLLMAMEISRGMNAKRLIHQLHRHVEALKLSALGVQTELLIGHKVMVVCEEKSLLQGIWKRFPEFPRLVSFAHFFLFTTWDAFRSHPETCWQIFGNSGRFNFLTGRKIPNTS